jgi:hypothetical protein
LVDRDFALLSGGVITYVPRFLAVGSVGCSIIGAGFRFSIKVKVPYPSV